MIYQNQNNTGAQRQMRMRNNEWTGTGTVCPRAKGRDIRYIPFQNGGGCIHISLAIRMQGANGQTDNKVLYLPVDVFTNSIISADTLQNVRPGMQVRVAGTLTNQYYEDRNGQTQMLLVVRAFVFEILDQPAAAAAYEPSTANSYE